MERPKTSQKVIDLISQLVDSQDQKGLMKYGKSIDEANEYDWNRMALEEMVDGMKYMVKENEYLNKRLREFNKKTWFPVYEENLRLAEDNKRMHKHIIDRDKTITHLIKENEKLNGSYKNLDYHFKEACKKVKELQDAKNNSMEQNLHLISSIDKLNLQREKMLNDFVNNEKHYQKIEEENERLKNDNTHFKQKYENLKMILNGFVEKYGRLK